MKKLNIGDNVRFLNEVGGGTIVKIDEQTKMVYVQDADGFEIPVLPQECVVVNNVKENNFPTAKEEAPLQTTPPLPNNISEKKVLQIIETPEGEDLNVVLAFIPCNIKTLQTTNYDCYIINDSNYQLFYNIASVSGTKAHSLANGQIEPNMQEQIATITKDELNDWEKIRTQVIPFKLEKSYELQNAIDCTIKINPTKFYKLHCFNESVYFDTPSIEYNLAIEANKNKLEDIKPEAIKEAMMEKETKQPVKLPIAPNNKKEIIEVDLHINQLLDNTNGLKPGDMLNYQMEVFHKTLAEHKKDKGQKIVFIHGKGEGVLRKEIEKALKNKYKSYTFQDASFREYGYGATLVTIK